jgi:hypothetical protein
MNYSLNVECNPDDPIACSQTQAAANAAASNIATAGGSSPSGGNATINISWSTDNNNNNAIIGDSTPIVLADGTASCEIKIFSSNAVDLNELIGHEMGHCMGLDHSSDASDIMAAIYKNGSQNFSADDKALLSALRSGADIQVSGCSFDPRALSCDDPSTQVVAYDEATNQYSCETCATGTVPMSNVSGVTSCQTCPSGSLYQQIINTAPGVSVRNKCNNACSPPNYPPGYVNNVQGNGCVPSCGSGKVLNAAGNQCMCAPGSVWNLDSQSCVSSQSCTLGYLAGGTCYPPASPSPEGNSGGTIETTPPPCLEGYTRNDQGNCEQIQSMFHTDCGLEGQPACTTSNTPVTCPSGYEPAPDGSCQVSSSGTSNTDSGGDYCSAHPADANCADLCAQDNPPPSCIGNSGSDAGSTPGGDGGSGPGSCGTDDLSMIMCNG